MATTKNKERPDARAARDNRERIVAGLLLDGYTQNEIARRLNSYPVQIMRDARAIRARWQAEATSSYEAAAARELASIARDEAALRAEAAGLPEDAHALRLQFHDRIAKLGERRVKLLGVEAPTKTQISGPGGGPIPIAGVDLTALFLKDPEAAAHGVALLQRMDAVRPVLALEGNGAPTGAPFDEDGDVGDDGDEAPTDLQDASQNEENDNVDR